MRGGTPRTGERRAAYIAIYKKDYRGFSAEIRELFEVKNSTDAQTDYFETDRIRVTQDHPLWGEVAEAFIKKQRFEIKGLRRRKNAHLLTEAIERREAELEEFIRCYSDPRAAAAALVGLFGALAALPESSATETRGKVIPIILPEPPAGASYVVVEDAHGKRIATVPEDVCPCCDTCLDGGSECPNCRYQAGGAHASFLEAMEVA